MDSSSKKILAIIHLIITVVCVGLCVWAMILSGGVGRGLIADFLELAALVLALFYLFKGYKKAAAKYYHWFLVSFTIAVVFNLGFDIIAATLNGVTAILGLGIYGMLCILAVAKDLGKKNSMILGVLILAESIILLVVTLVYTPGIIRGGDALTTQGIIRAGVQQCMAIILNVMIIAKYKDKAARGSK